MMEFQNAMKVRSLQNHVNSVDEAKECDDRKADNGFLQ